MARSDGIVIDGSAPDPPEVPAALSWSTDEILLVAVHAEDPHSGIVAHHMEVTSPTGDPLGSYSLESDGDVSFSLVYGELEPDGEVLLLALSAENGAGLVSAAATVEVTLIEPVVEEGDSEADLAEDRVEDTVEESGDDVGLDDRDAELAEEAVPLPEGEDCACTSLTTASSDLGWSIALVLLLALMKRRRG